MYTGAGIVVAVGVDFAVALGFGSAACSRAFARCARNLNGGASGAAEAGADRAFPFVLMRIWGAGYGAVLLRVWQA